MTSATVSKEREAFEAWYAVNIRPDVKDRLALFEQDMYDQYRYSGVEDAWRAWQAATERLRESVPVEALYNAMSVLNCDAMRSRMLAEQLQAPDYVQKRIAMAEASGKDAEAIAQFLAQIGAGKGG